MKRLFSALALVLLQALPVSSQALEKVTFLTNYVFLGRHAPFFLGLDKGFYRDAGFDITIAPSTGSGFVISALEGGQADFGIAEVAPVIQAVGKGAQVRAFGVYMDESTSGLASLVPYRSLDDLRGKTIAASLTDSARVILPILYQIHGGDPGAIEWMSADPSTYFPLLLRGRADAVTASIDSDVPTFRRVAERQGKQIHFASFAEWGYDVFGYFLVARADRIASRPDEVRAFAKATALAVRYAIDHPDEAVESLVRHNPTLDKALMRAHWSESMRAIDTSFVHEHGYGVATEARLAESIRLVQRAFHIDRPLAAKDVFAFGFLEPQ